MQATRTETSTANLPLTVNDKSKHIHAHMRAHTHSAAKKSRQSWWGKGEGGRDDRDTEIQTDLTFWCKLKISKPTIYHTKSSSSTAVHNYSENRNNQLTLQPLTCNFHLQFPHCIKQQQQQQKTPQLNQLRFQTRNTKTTN